MIASGNHLRVLSHVPGRIRLHIPGWIEEDREKIQKRLERVNGVQGVQVNPLTGNILVHFDQRTMGRDTILAKVNEILVNWENEIPPVSATGSTQSPRVDAGCSPARFVVRGLLGHAIVDSLWFGAGFLGSAVGLPLAGLGPLHVLLDIAVWMTAVAGETGSNPVPNSKQRTDQSAITPTHRSTRFEPGNRA